MTTMTLTNQYQKPLPWISRRLWLGLGAAFIGLGMFAGLAAALASGKQWWLHVSWCVIALVTTVFVLVRCLRKGFLIVITDHLVMFTAAFMLYFVVGASFLPFGPARDVAAALYFYPVNATSALWADAVNSIGFGLAVLVTAAMPTKWMSQTSSSASVVAAHMSPRRVLLILSILGLVAFGYTLLYDFAFRQGVVSGIIRAAAAFPIVAAFLAASYKGRHSLAIHVFAVIFAAVLAFTGLLMFDKTQVLLSLGALIAGLSLVFRARRVLTWGIVAMIAIYVLIGGAIMYGRNVIGDRPVALAERLAIVVEGFSAARSNNPLAATSSWGRLCYLPSQAAAMDFFDHGEGGHDFSLLPWVLVPRILFPDKPSLTHQAVTFTEKITGNANSHTGQGVFSSGYYSGGWLGVLAAAILAGIILAQTSALARAVMKYRATLLLPLALYGVFIAFRIDGTFLVDYAGAFVILLYTLLAFRLVLGPRRRVRVLQH